MSTEFKGTFIFVLGVGIYDPLWRITYALWDMTIQTLFTGERMETPIAYVCSMLYICSACDQSGHVFYPGVVPFVSSISLSKSKLMWCGRCRSGLQYSMQKSPSSSDRTLMLMLGFIFSNLGMSFIASGKFQPSTFSVSWYR